ncbi:MAG: ATP-dependent Clp protease proteolytic subunit [Candidatus Saccharimonas sp.]
MNKPNNYLVPNVIVKTRDGERGYDIYSRLLEDRIIFLGEEVNQGTANVIVAQLLHLANEDPNKDIHLYINSPGGSVYDGLAILDTMNFIKPDVATYGIGLQASFGAVLLAAGAKSKRRILPHASVMMHQPHGGSQGQITDQEISLKEGVRLKELLIDEMTKYTGQKRAKIKTDMERDFWMGPKEAVAYGIADEVLKKAL